MSDKTFNEAACLKIIKLAKSLDYITIPQIILEAARQHGYTNTYTKGILRILRKYRVIKKCRQCYTNFFVPAAESETLLCSICQQRRDQREKADPELQARKLISPEELTEIVRANCEKEKERGVP